MLPLRLRLLSPASGETKYFCNFCLGLKHYNCGDHGRNSPEILLRYSSCCTHCLTVASLDWLSGVSKVSRYSCRLSRCLLRWLSTKLLPSLVSWPHFRQLNICSARKSQLTSPELLGRNLFSLALLLIVYNLLFTVYYLFITFLTLLFTWRAGTFLALGGCWKSTRPTSRVSTSDNNERIIGDVSFNFLTNMPSLIRG